MKNNNFNKYLWRVTEYDGTETDVTDYDYHQIIGAQNQKISLVTIGEQTIAIGSIKRISRVKNKEINQLSMHELDWTGYSEDILQVQYEAYVKNKKTFRQKMLAGKFEGFATQNARQNYLNEYFSDEIVSFEEFKKQHSIDISRERPNKYMTEFFWDDPYGYEEIGFMTDDQRRGRKSKISKAALMQ